MTTYELPPEPPIGTQIVDNRGISWKRARGAAYGWDSLHMGGQCWNALLKDGPLTLIEPDPWPTDDLIVADWIAGAAKGHGLLYLDGHEYVTIESGHVLREGRDTLANVVPVRVVPVAEMRHARETLAAADAGDFDSFIGSFRKLIAATDAMGVDL